MRHAPCCHEPELASLDQRRSIGLIVDTSYARTVASCAGDRKCPPSMSGRRDPTPARAGTPIRAPLSLGIGPEMVGREVCGKAALRQSRPGLNLDRRRRRPPRGTGHAPRIGHEPYNGDVLLWWSVQLGCPVSLRRSSLLAARPGADPVALRRLRPLADRRPDARDRGRRLAHPPGWGTRRAPPIGARPRRSGTPRFIGGPGAGAALGASRHRWLATLADDPDAAPSAARR